MCLTALLGKMQTMNSIFILFRYEWASGTITLQDENDFIVNNLNPNYHWLGGLQPDLRESSSFPYKILILQEIFLELCDCDHLKK